jgi:hypothetical protein
MANNGEEVGAMQRFKGYCWCGVVGLLAAASACAADPAAMSLSEYARLPVCTLSADGQHLAVEACRTAPARSPMSRRPVPQIVQRQPSLPLPRALPMPPVPASPSLPSLLMPPGAPTPALNCDAGGCYDLNGVRHNNAAGNSTLTPSGKLCIHNGPWLQCQ